MSSEFKVELSAYLDRVNEASARVRQTLYVLVTASIVIFAAVWDTQSTGWPYQRAVISQAEYKYFGWDTKKEAELSSNKAQKAQLDLFRRSKQYANLSGHWDQKFDTQTITEMRMHVKALADAASKSYADLTIIKVPVFGVAIDVNDFGTLGGFVFVATLTILSLSLFRQHSNLKIAFSTAIGAQQLGTCYKLLSMSQVLTIPPAWGHQHDWRAKLSFLPRLLYLLPLGVQLFVFLNDRNSFNSGSVISPEHAAANRLWSTVSLIIIALITVVNMFLVVAYDREWARHANNPPMQGASTPK